MSRKKKPSSAEAKGSIWSRMRAWLRTSKFKCAAIYMMGGLLLYALICLVCAPERYSLVVGSISRQTITATKDVVDEITTEENRKAAANAVEPSYHLEEGVSDDVLSDLANVFDQLRTVQQYGLTLRADGDTADSLKTRSFSDAELEYAQKLVTAYSLSRYQATTLLRTDTADFDVMVSTVTTAVGNALNTGIREGKVSDAISTIQQIVGSRVDISLVQNVLPSVLRTCLKPNLVIDQDATDLARQNARDSVDPVVYLQGQNIIREGEIVRQNQYVMLKSLGLLADNQIDYTVYIGAAILIGMGMFVLLILMRMLHRESLHDIRKTSVIVCTMVLGMAFCAICVKLTNVYFAPVALCAILLTTLFGWRISVPVAVAMSFMLSGFAAGDSSTQLVEMIYMLLMGLIGGIVSIHFLRRQPQRIRVLICGIVVGFVNAVIMMTMWLMTSLDNSGIWKNMLWSFAGGVLSGTIAVGLQPVLEATFNLATSSKLLELCNPNHPLLRRLLLEASGTYHHSIIVANLAEAAAEEIGANPLLTRAGAYFHDVGKLKRPQYFKENQINENPLNETDPYVSAAIVTAHTRDGYQLAQKYRLPIEIQQIILEHHGDTPVMYFYHKALQMADGKPVDIADFRYDGPRPQSREAAIVMLADTSEAAVRSMSDPSPQAIRDNIERLVRGKLEDGQLSESPLTLKDIDGICSAFSKVLNGVFHERIEYPSTEVPKRGAFLAEDHPAEENHDIAVGNGHAS